MGFIHYKKLDFFYSFNEKLVHKKYSLPKKIFIICTNSNMLNLMVICSVSVLDWKHPFWVYLVQNLKDAYLY